MILSPEIKAYSLREEDALWNVAGQLYYLMCDW